MPAKLGHHRLLCCLSPVFALCARFDSGQRGETMLLKEGIHGAGAGDEFSGDEENVRAEVTGLHTFFYELRRALRQQRYLRRRIMHLNDFQFVHPAFSCGFFEGNGPVP